MEPEYITYLFTKAKEKSVPLSGTFELTNRCNFNCRMCYIHSAENNKQKNEELSKEQWMSLADEAKKAGTLFLLLTGGEPLLRSDFKEIYIYCKKLGFEVSVNTNASLVTDEIIEVFREYSPSRVSVSLYGPDEETYFSVTQTKGVYQKSVNSIKKMKEAGIALKINLTVSDYNSNKIKEIIEFSKENSIPLQYCNYLFPTQRVTKSINRPSALSASKNMVKCDRSYYSDEEYKTKFSEINNFKFEIDNCETECGDKMKCRGGSASFWITYDGNMLACGMMPVPKENIIEKGFFNAWKSVNKLSKEIILPAKCSTCKLRPLCDVCAASCYCETGRFDKVPEYLCKKAEEYVRLTKEELKNV